MNPPSLTFVFDVYSLPSAQHRAGLAGLVFVCNALKESGETLLPAIETPQETGTPGFYRVTWTPDSLRTVLNYLYNAHTPEIGVKQKWAGQEPLRVESKTTAEGKEEKVFIYTQVTPQAQFFELYGMPEIWKKLWFNALWQTLRAVPKTRLPYENRAAGKDAFDINKLWKELSGFVADYNKGILRTAEVAGSLFVGSQAYNADMVPFLGRVDENLLLHFWPVVMRVYQPEVIDMDGKTRFQGYVLTVPDVIDVTGFCEYLESSIEQLDDNIVRFRPKGAIISLPEEGALEYAYHLMAVAGTHARRGIEWMVCGMDVLHLEKQGNNVRMLASDRLELKPSVLSRYEGIRNNTRNPIFRRQLIKNFLSHHSKNWYDGFDAVFAKLSTTLFVGNKYPAGSFSGDISRQIQALKKSFIYT